MTNESLMQEAQLVADSLGPQAPNPSLYPSLVQAKLDALLYDEDAYGWLRSRLRMEPKVEILKLAWVFVKGILQILRDDNALPDEAIIDEASRKISKLVSEDAQDNLLEEQDDPMLAIRRLMKCMPGRLVGAIAEGSSEASKAATAWHARVARYLTFCVDGGLLGGRLTLTDILSHLAADITAEAPRRLAPVMDFLAHVRPKDLSLAWAPRPVATQIGILGLLNTGTAGTEEVLFTNRVMQAMIETGYFLKVMHGGTTGSVEGDYSRLVSRLLCSAESSPGLKASICRQVVATSKMETGSVVGLGLLEAMRSGGLFLATYACAALVNLCQVSSEVRGCLMFNGAVGICLQHLCSGDDDLMVYTLMLLVHLTKEVHHRDAFKQADLILVLISILRDIYFVWSDKRRIVAALCSVLGQMCNDADTRKSLNENTKVVDWLLQIFWHAEGVSAEAKDKARAAGSPVQEPKTISKVLFALKQLAADSPGTKEQVGIGTITYLVQDLRSKQNLEHRDWATNVIMLLLLLVAGAGDDVGKANVARMEGAKWSETYKVLVSSNLLSSEITKERVGQLERRVASCRSS